MIYERIKELAKSKGISVNLLETELDIAKGSLCKIDKHKPNSEKMQQLADFFKVSVDYLITGEQPEFTVEMAEKDLALSNMNDRIKDYALKLSELPKEKQEQIINLIDMLGE